MLKVKLELVLNENGVTFLNFWDNLNGKDVCCEVIDGKLSELIYTENDTMQKNPITLQEFIDKVHEQRKHLH